MEITNSKAVEILYKAIPYSEQIKDLQINANDLYFTWRGERFKYEFKYSSVMLSKGCILEGSNTCLLMEKLIKQEVIKD